MNIDRDIARGVHATWSDCVRWCHTEQSPNDVDVLCELLSMHCNRSQYAIPIVSHMEEMDSGKAGGYVIMYPGSLGSIGNLRVQSNEPKNSIAMTSSAKHEREAQAMSKVINRLCEKAFDQHAELVQAITPLSPSLLPEAGPPTFVSLDSTRDEAFELAGFQPVAKLVQLECVDVSNCPKMDVQSDLTRNRGPISMQAYETIPVHDWNHLVESTYEGTLDVPELNGKRRIENTLAGYAAASKGVRGLPSTWWVIACNDERIGCLLVTVLSEHHCELTYVGLLPNWRGFGISKNIMNFIKDWMHGRGIDRITLAVDTRNVPAIRLYQAFGFSVDRFVQAWIRSSVDRIAE